MPGELRTHRQKASESDTLRARFGRTREAPSPSEKAVLSDSRSAIYISPDQKLVQAVREGARSAGKDADRLRVLVESYVVVGGTPEAEEAARLWRFVPIGLKELLDQPDPRVIQRVAEERLPLQDVYRDWLVSDDPRDHIVGIQQQFDAGATDIFIHSGQADQQRVISFYAREVLPRVRTQT
jgi:alkanesulfonate monooxygenase SsuD/methylene tetrahydromethanopterin reductase-like flavin-dependent oxidoreductase (luciferase family)